MCYDKFFTFSLNVKYSVTSRTLFLTIFFIIASWIKHHQNCFKYTNGNGRNSPLKINMFTWIHAVYILRILVLHNYPYQRYQTCCKWWIAYVHTHIYCSFWCSGHKILGRLLLQFIWLWISMIDDSCHFFINRASFKSLKDLHL